MVSKSEIVFEKDKLATVPCKKYSKSCGHIPDAKVIPKMHFSAAMVNFSTRWFNFHKLWLRSLNILISAPKCTNVMSHREKYQKHLKVYFRNKIWTKYEETAPKTTFTYTYAPWWIKEVFLVKEVHKWNNRGLDK